MIKRQGLGFLTKIFVTNLEPKDMDVGYGEECILDTSALSLEQQKFPKTWSTIDSYGAKHISRHKVHI